MAFTLFDVSEFFLEMRGEVSDLQIDFYQTASWTFRLDYKRELPVVVRKRSSTSLKVVSA